MSHTNVSASALNHDLLKQAQAYVEKSAAPSAPVARIANALAARAADVTKTLGGAAKPVAAAGASLPTSAALPTAPQPVARIVDALRTRADDVGKQMSSLYKPDAVPYQDSIMANNPYLRKPGYAGMPNYAELYGPGPYGPHVKTSAYGAYADWTPQQFGLLVGHYTSKQGAANPVDAHGTSFIPVVGGAISGAVKQHPGLGSMNSVAREGAAGVGGGITGGMVGAGLGLGASALGNLVTRGKLGFKSNIASGLAGALAGSSAGTHMAAQTSRENVPMNARALFAATPKAGGKQASLANYIDPARAQQLQAQQGPRVPSGPGGGLLMPAGTLTSRKALAPSPNSTGTFGGPMSTVPMAPSPNSTGTFGGAGAGTSQGGIMGGGGPLSMSLAGKQAGILPTNLLSRVGGMLRGKAAPAATSAATPAAAAKSATKLPLSQRSPDELSALWAQTAPGASPADFMTSAQRASLPKSQYGPDELAALWAQSAPG